MPMRIPSDLAASPSLCACAQSRMLQRRPERALGVVLVGDRRPEHAEHDVAGELVHGAAEALDLLLEPGVERSQDGADVLGIGTVEPRREPRDVGEQHRDEAPFLAGSGRIRADPHAMQNRERSGFSVPQLRADAASPECTGGGHVAAAP